MTRIFLARESRPGETRVAATPETVARLVKYGLEVRVAAGAGAGASFTDTAYEQAGAHVVDDGAPPQGTEIVLRVAPPTPEEAAAIPRGALLVSFLHGVQQPDTVRALRDAGATAWAMELIPRTTRAQKMDALSSQANVAGYKSVLIAAVELGKYFPLLMTAAGTVKPARVVIFGVGVAGLQAIATAKRLGAQVEATDIRPETKEQVESLGGKFISVEGGPGSDEPSVYAKEADEDYKRRQRAAVEKSVAAADVVITTAQVPGRRAPLLVPRAMVESMRPGSVIVDLAVEQGGNCELSEEDRTVDHRGVKILGTANLPATVPVHASELFARNVLHVLEHVLPKAEDGSRSLTLDFDDEITGGSVAVHGGEVRHQPTAEALQPSPAQ